jgi:hypothetical protein
MTTYYAKPFEELSKAIYDTNPALYVGIASKVGRFPLEIADPWNTDWVHFNSIKKATKSRMADEPGWDAIPDSIPDPGMVKAKWFYWNHELTEKQYKSLEQNPNGVLAEQIRSEIRAQQDAFIANVDHYLGGFLYSATDADYDQEWRPLFKNKAATGTVSDPEDINSTPGTTTATGIKLSGAGRDADAFEKSIGLIKERFYQQYDSVTKQAMYRQTNSFDMFLHPAVVERLKNSYNYNAGGYSDYSRNLLQIAESVGINVTPTFMVDSAYDGASTTVAEAVMTMNTSENFQISEMIPYTIEPYQYNPVSNKWRMRAYWKILPFVRPYLISGSWKKAMTSFSYIPYNA